MTRRVNIPVAVVLAIAFIIVASPLIAFWAFLWWVSIP